MLTRISVLFVVLATAAGCRNDLRPANYRALSVTFGGPTSIVNGSSTTYTSTVNIERIADLGGTVLQNLRIMVKNAPADDQELARIPITWGPNDTAPKTVSFSLSCAQFGPGFGVKGSFGASEKGGAICTPIGSICRPNPAVTYAFFSPLKSTTIPITCAPGGGGGGTTASNPTQLALCASCSGLVQGNCRDGLVCHSGRCEEPCPPWKSVGGDCKCR